MFWGWEKPHFYQKGGRQTGLTEYRYVLCVQLINVERILRHALNDTNRKLLSVCVCVCARVCVFDLSPRFVKNIAGGHMKLFLHLVPLSFQRKFLRVGRVRQASQKRGLTSGEDRESFGKSGELPEKFGKVLGNLWIACKFHISRTSGVVGGESPGVWGL